MLTRPSGAGSLRRVTDIADPSDLSARVRRWHSQGDRRLKTPKTNALLPNCHPEQVTTDEDEIGRVD